MSSFDEEPDGEPHGECAARIAELEAALIGLFGAVGSALSTFNLPCTDRILTAQNAARAALAGKEKARPAQDDGGYELVAAWDASKYSNADMTDAVHPMFQAGWDAAKAAPRLTDAQILDIRAQSYIGIYGPRPYLDELAFARAIEAKVRGE